METKIADNYIFESVLDKSVSDSDKTPFVRKNLNYIVDQQAGNSNYTSGQVIIDASSLASSGTTFQDWSNAYVVLPYNVKVEATMTGTASGLANAEVLNYLSSLKNNALIDSITVEQAGRKIIDQTNNLSQLVNFKMHSTTSQDVLNKMAGSLMYYPDGVGAYEYGPGIGVQNFANDPTQEVWNYPESHNSGALARQQKLFPYTSSLTTKTKQMNEGSAIQTITNGTSGSSPLTSLSATPTNVVLSDIHLLATIRLKDLCDYFDKHPKLTRGIGYKIYLRINQGITTFTHTASLSNNNPFVSGNNDGKLVISAQVFTPIGSSLTQPAMIHVGPGTIISNPTDTTNPTNKASTPTWGTACQIAANSLKLTSQVDVGANALMNGIRLYVPSYEASPKAHEELIRQPPLSRPFFDVYHSVISSQQAGSSINTQIASGIASPKAIIVVPQIAQTVNNFNSQGSALNPSPGCTDPQLSLTNIQIKLGSQYILPDRVNYDFVQFLENNSQLFGLNGNQTQSLSSGLIDYQKFLHNYRYYAYDLSRYLDSADSIPQMITFESFNNSNVAVDLYVYVLYERSAEFSLEKGAVQVE